MSFSHINDIENFNKAVDFGSLAVGQMRPTDIDMSFEFDNKVFVLVEFKCGGARCPRGQWWSLTRTVDRIQGGLEYQAMQEGQESAQDMGMGAFLVVAEHERVDVPNASSSIVRSVYWKGENKSEGFNGMTVADFFLTIGKNLNNRKVIAAGEAGLAFNKANPGK